VQKRHYKLGAFHRVAEHLFRYSVTKKYYAVFKCNGKTRWISLKTTDSELAGKKVKEEIAKHKKTDAKASTMTLEALLALYEQSIQGLVEHTQGTRKSILKSFKNSWKHGLDLQVRAVTKGQLDIWLSITWFVVLVDNLRWAGLVVLGAVGPDGRKRRCEQLLAHLVCPRQGNCQDRR
jgi:hypothetical protein